MRTRNFILVHASRSIRAMLKKHILADLGDVDIIESTNGQDALVQLANKAFDLVICNSKMVDMSIADLRREAMAAGTHNSKTEYIVLSESDEDRDQLVHADFKYMVTLPFDHDVFISTINQICNPRKWRRAERFHIPDSKVIINVWGMEAEAVMINISLGGVLVEVSGDRSELLLQNNPKLTLKINVPDGYRAIAGLPAKLARLNTIAWNSEYKPTVMRVAYVFLDLDQEAAVELEQAIQLADKVDVVSEQE